MEPKEARAYLNYLLTLNIRREESFGPLALTFIKDHDLPALGLLPEEQFSLIMATVQVFAAEPKRYNQKLELLKRARDLLGDTQYAHPDLARQIDNEIKKTDAELDIYNKALRPEGSPSRPDKQRLIVQTDVPEYFLDLAQRRAGEYYQKKYQLSRQAKTAQHFGGGPRKFEPENKNVQKEFPGACAPFMNSRTNAFHLMLPFDLRVSRKPDEMLDGGVRVFYSKEGYSFPLSYEMDKLCSYHDGEVLDIQMDDPNLVFVSVSAVKDRQFRFDGADPSQGVPPELAYPRTVLERVGTLGTFIQIVTNFKIWFDASAVSVLIQGAPDLHEYGFQGGSGLMTRTHASDKIDAYAESGREPWQEGMSFNFVNMHLQLSPGVDTGFVPFNTPIFTVHPVLARQEFKFEDARAVAQETARK